MFRFISGSGLSGLNESDESYHPFGYITLWFNNGSIMHDFLLFCFGELA
jgi:hypothetical protein